MLALSFDGSVSVADIADPQPAAGEALIAVRRAGICNTDLEIVRGYMGHRGVLGHEFVGEVEACEDAAWVGRRVVGEINLSCGACPACGAGLGRHCEARRVLGILNKDGCFAQRVTLPIANLHAVPGAMDDAHAAFVEPLAAAFEILEQLPLAAATRVAVLGDGKLGLLVAMMLVRHGCAVTVVGRHPRKLAVVAKLGARTCGPGELDDRVDVVVEATGSSDGLRWAVDHVAPRGTIVLKSTFHGTTELALAPVVVREITLVGSRCGPFAPALQALADGSIDPTPLIDATYPLRRGAEALEHARRPGVLKVVLES